jgi:hypothetical protein
MQRMDVRATLLQEDCCDRGINTAGQAQDDSLAVQVFVVFNHADDFIIVRSPITE